MNAKEAYELLKPIPKDQFTIGKYTDGMNKCCAIGHLIRLTSEDPSDYSINNCCELFNGSRELESFTRETIRHFSVVKHNEEFDLAQINNDSRYNGYTENNPKDRVMHLLEDVMKWEE